MSVDIEDERKKFQQWLRDLGYSNRTMKRSWRGAYAIGMFNECFEGWKARASIAQKDTADAALNAARYKWLRENASVVFTETQCWKLENGQPIYSTMPGHLELDAAIDAAIAAVDRQVFCSFPDCGCDCSRLCMATEGPNACAMDWNVDKASIGVKP